MTRTLLSLYPEIEPYDRGFLALDGLHTMYYEQSGNPDGVPVVYLHGGPGGCTSPKHRRFFDPAHYRIILLDQRGCGQSTPLAETRDNTTQHLVNDLEELRRHLDIDTWHVFGGSWGSTLALAYAIALPERVLSLTLRGIFTMTAREIDWFLYGVRAFFPDAWEDFTADVPDEEKNHLLDYYTKKFSDPDPDVRLRAAKTWAAFESACCTLIPRPASPEDMDPRLALAIATIEAHYFKNNRFEPDDYIIRHIHAIRHIPAVIVQGRYDAVCPIVTAHELHRAWPEARFVTIPDAGHSASEPGITDALIQATDSFRAISP